MLCRIAHRLRVRQTIARGWIRAGGQRLYFPPDSESALRFVQHGTYEPQIAELMAVACRPQSLTFDVGANIGISAVPLLARHPDIRLISFEVSPVVLPFLKRTHAEVPVPRPLGGRG